MKKLFRISRSRKQQSPVQNDTAPKEEFLEVEMEVSPEETVLDVLERIRRTRDSSLVYRHSCHHGSCGTCGCIVNGRERLACVTRIESLDEGPVTLEPLRGMRVIADIAVEPSDLFTSLPLEADYLRPSDANTESLPPEEVGEYQRFENCIECGCCVSVCPVREQFIGPAALALYNRQRIKHPEEEEAILDQVDSPRGVWGCARALECSRVCPAEVYPSGHILKLRKRISGEG